VRDEIDSLFRPRPALAAYSPIATQSEPIMPPAYRRRSSSRVNASQQRGPWNEAARWRRCWRQMVQQLLIVRLGEHPIDHDMRERLGTRSARPSQAGAQSRQLAGIDTFMLTGPGLSGVFLVAARATRRPVSFAVAVCARLIKGSVLQVSCN
jgi:hypothetical protein